MRTKVATFFAVALATFATGATAATAPATSDDPGYAAWIGNARAVSGEYCCTHQDVHPVADDEWRVGRDGYEIKIGGVYIAVPADRVLKDNPTGRPLVWYRTEEGSTYIYCFAPGSLG